MYFSLKSAAFLLSLLLAERIATTALAADPSTPAPGGSIRQSMFIEAGGYAIVAIDATAGPLTVAVQGGGVSNLDLVLIDREFGMLAASFRPGDHEALTYRFERPRPVYAMVLNNGKSAAWATVSAY